MQFWCCWVVVKYHWVTIWSVWLQILGTLLQTVCQSTAVCTPTLFALYTLGNTCHLNSLLQCIFAIDYSMSFLAKSESILNKIWNEFTENTNVSKHVKYIRICWLEMKETQLFLKHYKVSQQALIICTRGCTQQHILT